MRTITAAQQAVLDSGVQAEHLRVSVKDAGGTWRDLTTYPGFNAVKAVTWAERVDGPHMTCDVTLHREQFKLSLNPLHASSALNKGFDPAASYAALIALTRELKVEVAIVPQDKQPTSGDWMLVFHGRIDEYDSASGYDIRLGCRSLGGRLAQQYIKTELVYSFASVAGVAVPLRVWEPQIPVTLNTTYVLPASRSPASTTTAADPGYNKFLKCSQSGTTGTAEPVWTTGTNQVDGTARWDYVGAPSSGGNPVEQIMQNILDGHRSSTDPTVTLYTPTSPSWAIRQFVQQREFVLDALTTLAKQIGWDLRYKWRSSTSQFELTFYQPNRTSPTVAFAFSAADYEDPTRLAVNIANIRNSWRVVYSDRADLWPDGQPKRKVIEVSDSASIAKYGELWAEIQEGDASQIDTSTEATALVNAALSDCKEPTAELSVALTRGFPWVELNDYYSFSANERHFTNVQSLAVTGWSQSFENGRLRTTFELRGAPTIGTNTWLISSVHPARPPRTVPPGLSRFDGTGTPTVIIEPDVVGGFVIRSSLPPDKASRNRRMAEVHSYEASGTPLSSSTLKAVIDASGGSKTINDLVPGKSYFGRVVPLSYDESGALVRGQPSAEFSAVAGRAKAGHYDSASPPGLLPLNGNFEHSSDDLTTAPFDHWKVVEPFGSDTSWPNAWGSGESVYYGTDSTKGKYLKLKPGDNGARGVVESSRFEIRRGAKEVNFYISIRKSASSALSTAQLSLNIRGYTLFGDSSPVYSRTKTFSASATGDYPTASTWYNVEFSTYLEFADLQIPTNVNFLELRLYRGTTTPDDHTTAVDWDIGDLFVEVTGAYSVRADRIRAVTQLISDGALTVEGTANFNGTLNGNATSTFAQPAWTAVTFENSFSNYGSGWVGAAYFKDSNGVVHLRGLVARASAALSTAIFTLPTGFRPSASIMFAVTAANQSARLDINTSGQVAIAAADSATWYQYISLDGVTFDTR